MSIRRQAACVGTAEGNDVVVQGPGVAPWHGQFRLRGGVWTFTDLDAPAGSWIDGEPVRGEALLAPGSAVKLGELSLVFDPLDDWQDSGLPLPTPDRPTPNFFPEERRNFWPALLIVLALAGIAAALFLLHRSS